MKKLTKANANNGRGFTAAKAGDKSGFRIKKESVWRTILHQPNNMSPAQWVPDCIGNILDESCSDFPLPEADKAIIHALTYDGIYRTDIERNGASEDLYSKLIGLQGEIVQLVMSNSEK